MMSAVAKTPDPPYYAVIFTSVRRIGDNGYEAMADEMVRLGTSAPGFLGIESFRDDEGCGITVSYWDSLSAIAAWKENFRHQFAQKMGREMWYSEFATRVCRVDRQTFFNV